MPQELHWHLQPSRMRVNFNILYAPIFENISLLIFANGTGLYSENVLDILDVPSLSIKPFRLAHIPGLTWEEYGISARFIDDKSPCLADIQDKPAQSMANFF